MKVNTLEPSAALKRKANEDENKNAPLKKRAQWDKKFKEEYSVKFACISTSEKSIFMPSVRFVGVDFSISHGWGEHDVIKRIKSNKHQQAWESAS